MGGPDGSKAEFIYLNQILSCLGKEADSEQAEVIQELIGLNYV